MSEIGEERVAQRVDGLVAGLLAGRRLRIGPGDAAERDAFMAAAALAGTREGYQRMSSRFRRRLLRTVEKSGRSPEMSRRAAIVAGVGVAGAAVGGTVLGRFLAVWPPLPTRLAPPPVGAPARHTPAGRSFYDLPHGRWQDTGLASGDLIEGQPQQVQAGAVRAFLVRKGEKVMGLSALCTHLPCELLWKPADKVLACPCHNVAFDTDGYQITSPESYPLPPLPRIQVRVTPAGRVEVGSA